MQADAFSAQVFAALRAGPIMFGRQAFDLKRF